VKLVHLVGFITKKFVTMQHGQTNVKNAFVILLYIFAATCFGFNTKSHDMAKIEYQIKVTM